MDGLSQARHDAQLGFLQQYLTESGLQSHIVDRSEEIPITVLLLPLMKDRRQRDRFLHFSFVPLDEDDLENIDLLQIYTTVPVEWKGDTKAQVEKLLLAINGRLAIGHFNLNGDEVNYRYVHCVPAAQRLQADELLSVIRLFELMLNVFASVVDDAASGRTSLQQALAEVNG